MTWLKRLFAKRRDIKIVRQENETLWNSIFQRMAEISELKKEIEIRDDTIRRRDMVITTLNDELKKKRKA